MKVDNKTMPLGIRIVSIWYYIIAGFFIIMSFFGAIITYVWRNEGLFLSNFNTFLLCIIFAIFFFFISKALSKRRNWARIAAIILSLFAALSFLYLRYFIFIIIFIANLPVLIYLLLPNTRKSFD